MNLSRYRWLCTFLLAGFLPSLAPAQELRKIQETQENQELGPLFFTPERRQELDRQRQFKFRERQEIPEDQTLTIDGVVTRSSGKHTVWINGIAREPLAPTTTSKRENPGTILVQTEDGPGAQARVGDTVNRNTGETSGLLDGGWILIKTPPD
jgi:hypothetical protein